MLHDHFGVSVSTQSRTALDHFEAAGQCMRLYRGDPVGALDAALAEDPDFTLAWATRAALLAQQTDPAFADEVDRSLRAGEACAARATPRERAHLAAARAWAEGRYHDSVSGFARIALDHPRDLVAIQNAHVGAFFTGRQVDLRDVPLTALRAWSDGDHARHAVLGMAAFGLEECGDYAGAQRFGEEAARIEPCDAWAVHAVAHVHEMRGDSDEGARWIEAFSDAWAPDCAFAYHNWWHLALYAMERGDNARALALYDEKVRPADSDVVLEWIDASALLWRLRLEGVDVGDRWIALADRWLRASDAAIYAFNDLHAIMAFLGAGRRLDAERTLRTMRRAAADGGDNAAMTREVGLPLAEAFVAFEDGRFVDAAETLARVRGIAQRFGGSHAQRDIVSLTLLHAALRGGMKSAAQSLAAERLAHKPQSPWAQQFAMRAQSMAGV